MPVSIDSADLEYLRERVRISDQALAVTRRQLDDAERRTADALELHTDDGAPDSYCLECGRAWPCRTYTYLKGDE